MAYSRRVLVRQSRRIDRISFSSEIGGVGGSFGRRKFHFLLHFFLELGYLLSDVIFDTPPSLLDGCFPFFEFFQFHFPLDVVLDLVDIALRPSEKMTQRTCDLRQPFRSEDNQRYGSYDEYFGEADVKHFAGTARKRGRTEIGTGDLP